MGVYLRAKFEVSSIILTSFRKGGGTNGEGGANFLSAQIRANDCFSIIT